MGWNLEHFIFTQLDYNREDVDLEIDVLYIYLFEWQGETVLCSLWKNCCITNNLKVRKDVNSRLVCCGAAQSLRKCEDRAEKKLNKWCFATKYYKRMYTKYEYMFIFQIVRFYITFL